MKGGALWEGVPSRNFADPLLPIRWSRFCDTAIKMTDDGCQTVVAAHSFGIRVNEPHWRLGQSVRLIAIQPNRTACRAFLGSLSHPEPRHDHGPSGKSHSEDLGVNLTSEPWLQLEAP